MDEYFRRWHEQQTINHARHRNLSGQFRPSGYVVVASAISRPIFDIVAGVLFAASGLVVEPYAGARTNGARGFAKGIGIGTVGVVTKPIVGLFDCFAHITETINDVARGVNFFEKRKKPVKKRRYPSVFGCNNILLPYNSIHARTVNLLRYFPVDDDQSKQFGDSENEILVVSEMLLLIPGQATYIAVTTRRIVLFEIQIDGGAPPERVWQIDFENNVTISSSVENFRHGGFVLHIHRQSSEIVLIQDMSTDHGDTENLNRQLGMKVNENYSLSPTNMNPTRNLNKWEEGKKFKKIYEQAGALLPNTTFPSRQNNRKPVFAEVRGDFQHSKELTRVHNAICCLTRQFDQIVRSLRGSNNTDGCTSFGNMHFVEAKFSDQVLTDDLSKSNLLRQLEHIPWVHFEYLQESTNDVTMMRKKWRYINELELSNKEGDPNWVIESRARCKFSIAYFSDVYYPRLTTLLLQPTYIMSTNSIIYPNAISFSPLITDFREYT